MTTGMSFALAVAHRAECSLAERASRSEFFEVGPLTVRLHAPAYQSADWIGRAFLPGEQIVDAEPSHELIAWDGTAAIDLPPRPPWEARAPEPLGFVASHSNENVRYAIDIHTESLIVSDFSLRSSFVWYQNIPALPAWAKASPFRIPLSWLCNRHGMQIVHGAAVGINGKAVLLAGDGGSGKSTTALACALAGFEYLGDDYCAVEPGKSQVHLVYRTAKLFQPTLALLPLMKERVENRSRMEIEKGVAFLDPDHITFARSADLSAILLPRVSDGRVPEVYPASREAVVKAVLPSTIGGLMGGTAVTPGMIMELVRNVPAFHLVLTPDMAAVVDLVAAKTTALE